MSFFECLVCVSPGVYVGVDPDISKEYVRGREMKLIVARLVKGPNNGKIRPGTGPVPPGHNAAGAGASSFYIIHAKQQLLPFAVVHFK